MIEEMSLSEDPIERKEAARILPQLDPEMFRPLLARFLTDADQGVLNTAVESAGMLDLPSDLLPRLFALLSRPASRRQVEDAIARSGERILDIARLQLKNPKTPLEVRRRIPAAIRRIQAELVRRTDVEAEPAVRDGVVLNNRGYHYPR